MAIKLKEIRKKKGMTLEQLAEASGISPTHLSRMEAGLRGIKLENAILLGSVLGVAPSDITGERSPPGTPAPPNATFAGKVTEAGRKIPVYGQAVGGEDGQFEMNGNTLFDVLAPPSLTPAANAYAICVSGSSMSPRYEDGEICFIDPTRRVRPGDYVVAQIREDEHGPPLAFIKRLVRWTTSELVLEQFNPPKNIHFPGDQVHSVHFVAMAGIA